MVRHPTWGIFEGPIIHSNDGINQWRSHRVRCCSTLLSYFRTTTSGCTEAFRCFWWTGVMFNYCINSVSWINFLRCHRSEALKLQSAINGREFVSVMAATDMRKRKAGNGTIKYTYRGWAVAGIQRREAQAPENVGTCACSNATAIIRGRPQGRAHPSFARSLLWH